MYQRLQKLNYWNVCMRKPEMQMKVCIVCLEQVPQRTHFFPEKILKLLTSAVSQFNMGCEASERVQRACFRNQMTSPKKINI